MPSTHAGGPTAMVVSIILTATAVFTRAGGPLAKAVFTEHDFGRFPLTKKTKTVCSDKSWCFGELIGSSLVSRWR